MQHQQREAVRPGAEEADIAEGEVAGEAVGEVQALRQHQEDDEVQQELAVVVHERQDDEGGDQGDGEQRQLGKERPKHGAPGGPAAPTA